MTTGSKLAMGGVILAGVTAYMAYRGAAASWQYYLTADECFAERTSLAGHRVRVSGHIAAGTLTISENRTSASFCLTGERENLKVTCHGPLPDNLTEGLAVLVEARLDDGGFLQGDKVLTRCSSKYQSRAPASSLAEGSAKGDSPIFADHGRPSARAVPAEIGTVPQQEDRP